MAMQCEKIVSYCSAVYQITCRNERERGAFVFKIMSMVYDKNVNSLEIIAFELDRGNSNLKS